MVTSLFGAVSSTYSSEEPGRATKIVHGARYFYVICEGFADTVVGMIELGPHTRRLWDSAHMTGIQLSYSSVVQAQHVSARWDVEDARRAIVAGSEVRGDLDLPIITMALAISSQFRITQLELPPVLGLLRGTYPGHIRPLI